MIITLKESKNKFYWEEQLVAPGGQTCGRSEEEEEPTLMPKVVLRIPTKPQTESITAKATIPQIINCLPSALLASSSELIIKNLITPQTNITRAKAKRRGIIELFIIPVT